MNVFIIFYKKVCIICTIKYKMRLIGIGSRLPLSFPRGMDCILTRLRLLRPSTTSDYRSVSDG